MAERRPRRERDEEVLVWPDLVFVEFIAAVLFLILLLGLSTAINAVLLDQANSDITPNPSKAPWYFLNLQELLLHMHPALAGVVVPTVALIILAAVPYIDRSHDGQGVWWGGTRNAVPIVLFSVVFTFVVTWLLIAYDAGVQDAVYNCARQPDQLLSCVGQGGTKLGPHLPVWLRSTAGLQTGIQWPKWTTHIPYLPFRLKLLDSNFLNLNFPSWLVGQGIPIGCMLGLPCVLLLALRKKYGPLGMRGSLYALFTGFMTVYVVLTIVGTAFRGQGMELLPPTGVHPPTGLGVD
jgi:menaquinol-cytochrome c reductase cytochrome b/c subunit